MNETDRNIAVVIEIENSMKYLKNGLAEVQKISPANTFYDPLLIYLSGGLERLFKSILCLNYQERKGRFPNYKELMEGENGHDIEFLKRKVEQICIHSPNSLAQKDYDIITRNSFIDTLCKILSEYGKKARYFNLDVILGKEQEYNSQAEWERIETLVLKEFHGEKEFYRLLELNSSYDKSNELLVSKIELYIRAITRQFIFGDFSSNSKNFISEIRCFTSIEDDQIGKTDYNKVQRQ